MAFPEKVLTRDEQVVEHLHPHWVTLMPATLWLVLICVASGVGITFLPDGSAHGLLVIAALVLAFLLLCWLTFAPWIGWRTTHY
ncbi:MAG: PH domain-containing protein, partial [Actinomycetota bacterium]|nr:PH domain-containing protein [Actinomycetota bacterium]